MPYDPNLADSYFQLGVKLCKETKFEEAMVAFTRAIKAYPVDPTMYVNRGLAFSELGKLDEANADFDKALAINPNLPQAYYNKARVLLWQKKLEEGVRHFERAAELGSKTAQALLNETLQPIGAIELLNAHSLPLLRAAVRKFPFMAKDEFIQFAEQDPLFQEDIMKERAGWLRQIASGR